MYQAFLPHEYRYDLSEPKFQTAFDFLRREDLGRLPEGWLELEHGVRASVQRYVTSPAAELDFETHEKYFDVQYMVDGMEQVGIADARDLVNKIPYDPENDIAFFHDPEASGAALLRAGDFVVLSPQDAHKPRCAAGAPMAVNKIVVKVPV